MQQNIDVVMAFISAVERKDRAALEAVSDPGLVQREPPNRITPAGATRNLAAMTEAFERGRALMRSERYEVRNTVASGEWVALQVEWTAELTRTLPELAPHGVMRGQFAMFFRVREGRVVEQTTYDCFLPA